MLYLCEQRVLSITKLKKHLRSIHQHTFLKIDLLVNSTEVVFYPVDIRLDFETGYEH